MSEERKRLIGDMRNPATRNCVECGKEFSTYRPIQKVCSPECREQRELRRRKEWYAENREYVIQMVRTYNLQKSGVARCRLCGKLIKQVMLSDHKGRAQMHDECVYNDAVKTLQSGNELTEVQQQRLRTRGYSIRELKNEINKEENNAG